MSLIRDRMSALILTMCFMTVLGCDSGPKVVPVSGVVRIDGQPLPAGFVQVAPTNHRAATGKIDADGRFTLTTTIPNDGCAVGTHAVAVIGTESMGPSRQKWHAPMKYTSADTSGLTITIDGPTENLVIDLTWDGGKSFVQEFGKE